MSRHGTPDDHWDDAHHDGHGHAASGLFDPHPDDLEHDPHPSGPLPASRASRRALQHQRRRRRRRRVVLGVVLVVIVALGVGAWQLKGRVFDFGSGSAADYTGSGTGSVMVTVQPGDGAGAIGQALEQAGVVKSADAFVAAARADSRANSIQPGVYSMRKQMSADAALALLLSPDAKQSRTLVIREGAIEPDVLKDLATALQVPVEQVQQAAAQIDQMGLPPNYLTPVAPTSLEGFLFPATYSFDPGTTPTKALQTIVAEFIANDRNTGFSDAAAGLGLTPYQLLTATSIAQAELIFPEDAAKVMRVILNRDAIGRPLQVDPTSAYAAKVAGVDPTTIDYATYDTPYNTYTHAGLPPGPIDSPGTAVMQSAAKPEAGNWIYYVTGDSEGHLFFTADEQEFLAAAQKCHDQGWGCADQGGG